MTVDVKRSCKGENISQTISEKSSPQQWKSLPKNVTDCYQERFAPRKLVFLFAN